MSPQPGLTVMAANLWHDWPRQHRWIGRLEAVADLVTAHGVDVILLQEVARTRAMRSDAWLAGHLGMHHAYARANGSARGIGFEEGLGILSRFPVSGAHPRRLTRNPLIRRVALAAVLQTGFGPVTAVSVHLGLIAGHQGRQVRRVRDLVDEVAGPQLAIIGGDFNATPARGHIGELRRDWVDAFHAVHPQRVSTTHRGRARGSRPGERLIDYVFVRQPAYATWAVVDASHVDGPSGHHSDHRAVIARLCPGS